MSVAGGLLGGVPQKCCEWCLPPRGVCPWSSHGVGVGWPTHLAPGHDVMGKNPAPQETCCSCRGTQ